MHADSWHNGLSPIRRRPTNGPDIFHLTKLIRITRQQYRDCFITVMQSTNAVAANDAYSVNEDTTLTLRAQVFWQ